MIENTNTKQFYPGPILNNTLEITDFLFNDAEQIKIKHSKLNDEGILIDVDLNYPTDYEVTKVLPSDINAAEAALTASTGQILLKNVNVLADEKLTVYRVSQIIQDKDYPRTGAFPAATHEGALDYLTMQNQEQKDEIDRALKVPVSTEGFNGSLPVPIPSRALKINNDGTGFEMSEFDPDLALVTTEEFKNQAQQAAIDALSSQTAAANSETIATQQSQNATTQAVNAKAYADNAAELNQQLTNNFNTYSSSLQGDFNTYTNNLTNTKEDGMASLANASNALRTTQITNCLLEVPQKIKLELNDGTLTLKAGSQVIVPNGFEADGTTLKFDYITIETDISVTPTSEWATGKHIICYNKTHNTLFLRISHASGTSPSGDYTSYYNTATNVVRDTEAPDDELSLPIGFATVGSLAITSIDQVFNGMGYIGSTIWVDKGVKGLIPDGRNADGSLNNVEFITDKISIRTFTNGWTNSYKLYFKNDIFSVSVEDVYEENLNISKYGVEIGTLRLSSDIISDFQPKLPFMAVDWNDALLKTDKTKIISWGMPDYSARISIASPYTVPKNGIVCVGATSATAYFPNLSINGVPIFTPNSYGLGWALASKGDVASIENINNAAVFYYMPFKGED